MPTTISTQATANNTYIITVAFTDDAGDAVTPNDGCTFSLKDTAGNTINDRDGVAIVEDTSVDVVLSGDDLAAQGANDNGIRIFSIDGTYDSDAGSDLPLDNSAQFVVDTLLPVSLQAAKDHLHIDQTNTDHDIDIALMVTSARETVEQFCRRKLITQTVTKYLQKWPSEDYMVLPYGNLQSVTSIKYTDSDGTQTTWDSGNYIVETYIEPGRVVLAYDEVWPTATLYPSNPIEVIYSCGYGAYAGSVPEMIKAAIKLLTSDAFENRETKIVGQGFTQLDTRATERLLYQHKVWGGMRDVV
jgi:uncharacterized phiE125 gp8 family phage protein